MKMTKDEDELTKIQADHRGDCIESVEKQKESTILKKKVLHLNVFIFINE